MYKFNEKNNLSGRSKFANIVCQLLYDKHDGDLVKASEEGEPFYDGLEEYVRNIYELVDSEIPLYALWYLRKHGAHDHGESNYGFSEEEYKQSEQNCIDACIKYYG